MELFFFFLAVPNFFLWLRLCPATGLGWSYFGSGRALLAYPVPCSSTKGAVLRGLLPGLE